jgi:hypothetical protein
MVTICSSVNRLFFMTSLSPLEAILSSFNWSENSRAGHIQQCLLWGVKQPLSYAGALGGLGAARGYFIGVATTLGLYQILKPFVYENLNPAIPALLQPKVANPVPGLAGALSGGVAGGTSSFVPGRPAPK